MAEEGRPTVMTKENIEKLRQGFLKGFTDEEACLNAGIHPSTMYLYQKDHPEFLEEKEQLKNYPKIVAKETIFGRLKHDVETSKWYLEHKSSNEFRKQSNTDITSAGKPLPIFGGASVQNVIPKDDSNSEDIQSK